LFVTGCVSRSHVVPQDSNTSGAFEYCGGTLWGYVVPVGPRQDKSWWNKDLSDPKPLLGVFLHMHSVLEKDPKHTLELHFAIRTREDLSIQIPDPIVTIKMDGTNEKKVKMNLVLTEEALRPDQIYRGPEYDFKLIDPKSNKWLITKKNKWLYLIKDDEREEILPVDRVQNITTAPINVKLDKRHFGEIFVLGAENIWPVGQSLKDAVITVTTPRLMLNGASYEARTFTFNMSYEKVKRLVGDRDYVKCPSTEMIFHSND